MSKPGRKCPIRITLRHTGRINISCDVESFGIIFALIKCWHNGHKSAEPIAKAFVSFYDSLKRQAETAAESLPDVLVTKSDK